MLCIIGNGHRCSRGGIRGGGGGGICKLRGRCGGVVRWVGSSWSIWGFLLLLLYWGLWCYEGLMEVGLMNEVGWEGWEEVARVEGGGGIGPLWMCRCACYSGSGLISYLFHGPSWLYRCTSFVRPQYYLISHVLFFPLAGLIWTIFFKYIKILSLLYSLDRKIEDYLIVLPTKIIVNKVAT